MKTGNHIIIAAFLLLSVSCQFQELDVNESLMTFYASGETSTRTQLGGESWGQMTRVDWSPSEEISIYCKGIQNKFVSTNTEVVSGTVEFVGTLPVRDRGDNPFWAVYPYSENNILDGSSVELTLPSEQEAVCGNVQRGLMASMARSQDRNLHFRHLFGTIRIGVYEKDIKKIIFKGNNGEPVAGRVRATFDENDLPVITQINSSSQEIVLLPPDGGTFNTEESYFVVCLPGAFEKGYTIEFYRDDLVSMKKIDTPVNLPRAGMVQLYDLYSGGIISSAEYNGKTYSLRYKTHPETYHWPDKGMEVNYWVTIGDEVIDIPEVFEEDLVSKSPTRIGPVVAFDVENGTFFFARPHWNAYGDMVNGVVYKYSSAGFEKKEIPIGYYPYFRFDEGQKRLELHSFSYLMDDQSCWHYASYHDFNDEWVKIQYNESLSEYESSGYYAKTVSDIILFFHEADPVDGPMTAVNLGLSVNWGECNLGAAAPERFGYYYAWGETEPKNVYSLDNYQFYDGEYYAWNKPPRYVYMDYSFCVPVFTKYSHRDQKVSLDPEDDAAHVLLGGDWRMPTPEEWQELIDNCSWEWTTVNGVAGQRGTSLKNGESIFLPAASLRVDDHWQMEDYDIVLFEYYYDPGFYPSSYTDQEWRSSSRNNMSYLIGFDGFSFDREGGMGLRYGYRWRGVPIRPVYGGSIPIEELRLNETYLEMLPRDTTHLEVTIVPVNATNQAITWSSSDDSVVRVTQAGKVTAVAEGTATITVTAMDGAKSAKCQVVVKYADAPTLVDMGLSVKWASFNVGASAPEEVGDYYAWGEVKPKDEYNDQSYKWYFDGNCNKMTKYCNNSTYGYNGFSDNKMVLDPEDDVAHTIYGGKWRMPTEKELIELCENTSYSSATLNGVAGYWVISNINGNRIFFPFSGYKYYDEIREEGDGFYWSSSLSVDSPLDANYLSFYSYVTWNSIYRELGLPVRAVYGDPAQGGNEDITPGGEINM
ncbi:MAG: Ig-like domain-containing protein [Bacteroidales bacterium]|nr:Ig-like domain-containing protein [Bacteroidales bacterium]